MIASFIDRGSAKGRPTPQRGRRYAWTMNFSRDLALRGSFVLACMATLLLSTITACGGDDDGDGEGGACDKGGPTGDSQETISVAGKERSFYVHIPASAATKSVALVFAFHGDGGNGKGFHDGLKLEDQTKDEAIVVYPDAQGGGKSFDDLTAGEGNEDLKLFDAIAAKYEGSHCITRTFAFGHSRGAYFTNHLACYRGSKLAAISAHSGGGPHAAPYKDAKLQCPDVPTASLIIHGLADTDVAPSEGQKSLDQWSRTLSCQTATKPVDPSPCVAYDGCSKPLESCQIPGLGHAIWDQAMATTWAFFKAQ